MRHVRVNNTGFDGSRYISSVADGTQPDPSTHTFNFNPATISNSVIRNLEPNFFNIYADKDFVLSYSCQTVAGIMKAECVILASRDRFPKDTEKLKRVEGALAQHGINKKFVSVNHENCPPIQVEKQNMFLKLMSFLED